MAKAVGADLHDAAMVNAFAPETYRQIVLKCTGCAEVEACKSWTRSQSATADAAPDYCRNKALFDTLTDAAG